MAELTPVRGIITTPQTEPLSGTGQISYGVTVGDTGATERWAYAPTPYSPAGGIYDVTTAGVWTRASDLDFSGGAGDFANMPHFYVREGNNRIAGSEWWYSGTPSPTEGVTQIPFTMRAHGDAWVPGTGMDAHNNELRLMERPDVAGTWDNATLDLTDRGIVRSVIASEAASADTFIEGLRLVWVSANVLRTEAGEASLPDGGTATLSDDTDKTLTLAADTWYYVYAFTSEGLGDWEYTTQAPESTPYRGTAKAKGPDATPVLSRRYLWAVRGSAVADTMYNFTALEGGESNPLILYREVTTVAPFRVVSGGTATTVTPVSTSALVPPTSRMAWMRLENTATSGNVRVYHENTGQGITLVPGERAYTWVALDASQVFSYGYTTTPSGGSFNADVLGYVERR